MLERVILSAGGDEKSINKARDGFRHYSGDYNK